eukprot:gnl/MRDRNA2_/MRDRNA2_144063_c0_seq1.p1 gnl/MRDRNA2_/MRDRNA2_144063_c0~~gnl/MRDRNA2_/MRDRNA2_144063_c0_seq1.p1  ORF type:complete len:337 (-),score=62.24 gnl/MRDRNA2_/MRDRNA2_144063_c0_seq1:145-1077(-)
MTPSCDACIFGDDDKYVKIARTSKTAPAALQKYQEALSIFHVDVLKNSSFVLACGYILLALGYVLFGGAPGRPVIEKLLNVLSISIEIFGLLMLRYKIQHRNSVSGISAQTMLMYAAVYGVRIWLTMPSLATWNFDVLDVELEASFGIISLLLVLDCLRSIFVNHYSSYQADLDVLHAKHLIPGCFLLASLLRPHFHSWSPLFGYMWSSCLYMDVMALMPQVMMMARGDGKVEAPIAHFVAATFLSRIEDLSDSLLFQGEKMHSDEYFSFYTIIFFQGLHLLLVADFIYYYLKARSSSLGDLRMDHVVEV